MFTVELIDDVQESVEAELTQLLADRLQISLRSILKKKFKDWTLASNSNFPILSFCKLIFYIDIDTFPEI